MKTHRLSVAFACLLGLVTAAGCSEPSPPPAAPAAAGPATAPDAEGKPPVIHRPDPDKLVVRAVKFNLNDATATELRMIPDVGERMAHEFEEYRPYVSIRQFRREMSKYVSDEQIAGYEKYVYVPIDPDACDVETLLQIPGLDAATADALIAARPYGSNAAFLEKLGEHLGAAEAGAVSWYLARP